MSLESAAASAEGCTLRASVHLRLVIKVFVECIHTDMGQNCRHRGQKEVEPVDVLRLQVGGPESNQRAGRRQDQKGRSHGSKKLFPVFHGGSFVKKSHQLCTIS